MAKFSHVHRYSDACIVKLAIKDVALATELVNLCSILEKTKRVTKITHNILLKNGPMCSRDIELNWISFIVTSYSDNCGHYWAVS